MARNKSITFLYACLLVTKILKYDNILKHFSITHCFVDTQNILWSCIKLTWLLKNEIIIFCNHWITVNYGINVVSFQVWQCSEFFLNKLSLLLHFAPYWLMKDFTEMLFQTVFFVNVRIFWTHFSKGHFYKVSLWNNPGIEFY